MGGNRQRVLFLCTHNSARSQMAEGLLRHLGGFRFEAASAGTEATFVRPEAARVMAEIGIDISGQESKTLERYLDEPFDYAVTVCDAANEACPVFPRARDRRHWSFMDPSQAAGSEEERLKVFRMVRDEIRGRIERELLTGEGSFSIGPARARELPEILTLLGICGLPRAGIETHLPTTLIARRDDRLVGSAALELCGPAALLRSVAVRPEFRGRGLGLRLSRAALDLAREQGVVTVYLLTETADGFFPRLGFRAISRQEVPEGVRRSVEFTTACPATARAMVLNL